MNTGSIFLARSLNHRTLPNSFIQSWTLASMNNITCHIIIINYMYMRSRLHARVQRQNRRGYVIRGRGLKDFARASAIYTRAAPPYKTFLRACGKVMSTKSEIISRTAESSIAERSSGDNSLSVGNMFGETASVNLFISNGCCQHMGICYQFKKIFAWVHVLFWVSHDISSINKIS